MSANRFVQKSTSLPTEERRRRKREGVLIVVILVVVAALTIAENRVIHFGADFPISNTILMFSLINLNLLLLILLIFLVFRNLVKLIYDRRRRVIGAQATNQIGGCLYHPDTGAHHGAVFLFHQFYYHQHSILV